MMSIQRKAFDEIEEQAVLASAATEELVSLWKGSHWDKIYLAEKAAADLCEGAAILAPDRHWSDHYADKSQTHKAFANAALDHLQGN